MSKLNLEEMVKEIAAGNTLAEEFCLLFINWSHFIDDVADQDRVWSVEDTARLTLAVVMVFGFNEFWLKHKAALMPLVVSGAKAWLDSLEWARREPVLDKLAAGVLKTQYTEALFYVAFLTGGWTHYDAMTGKYRSYTFD